MTMVGKKLTSVILTATMAVMVLLAFGAMKMYAEESPSAKAVEAGTSGIEPGNRIWFGNLDQGNTAGQQETKWRVLETSEDRAMLISEELLDRIQYDTANRDWNESKARDWCLNYYDNWKGSQLEKAAIAKTSKHDGRYQTGVEEIFGEIDITDEHFFLLSAEEADTLFENNADRMAYYSDGKTDYWWLRSDRPDYRSLAAFVWQGGSINNLWKSDYYGARPAFNLDLAPVMLISSPEGKSVGAIGELTEIGFADSNERKLTLYDAGRHFRISLPEDAELTAAVGYTDWTVAIDYSGAYVGANEYISALLCASDGEAVYYGSFIKNSPSGTLDIAIPDGLSNGKYELRLFSEQKNSGHITDYASAIETVELEVGCPEGGDHEWEFVNHKASFDRYGYQESVCSKCGESGGTAIGAMPVDIVKPAKKTYVYTGEAIEPEITVASSSDGPLSEDCYTVTYSDNVNPGTATATVTLQGDYYEGSKTLNFTIIPEGDTPPVIDPDSLQITFAEDGNYAVTGTSVNVSAAVSEESLDVSQVTLQYSKPISGDKESVQLTYNPETGKWDHSIGCDQTMERGTWKIYSIEVLDRGGSLTRITNSEFDSDSNVDLSAGDFQLRSTVTFDTRGGSSVEPQFVVYDEKATRPANPTKGGGAWHDGGDFAGWYADEAYTQEFSFDSPITEDTTVYVKWEYGFSISPYDKTNSADCAGGRYMVLKPGSEEDNLYAVGSNFTFFEGDAITLKAYPDQGYIFAGWYKGEYIGMVDYNHTQVSRPLDMSDPDNLLSTDPEYSFTVDRSAVICPVFEMCPEHQWEQKIQKATPDEDGRVYRTCPICNAEEIITPLLKVGNISLKADSFPYTGDAIQPEVIVANANERLSEDCYDVTYTDNVDPGTASVTVVLKGDYYQGSKILDFTIYENSTKTVETNISRIEPGNRIWFGNLDQDNTAAQPETKWRVLETSEDRAMLISEELLDRIQYDTENRDWNESKARDWCLNYYDNWKGSQLEKAAIAETSKHDGRYQTGVEEIFGEIDITDEHFFLLSAEEADTLFENNADRMAYYSNGKTDYWWLRSDRPDYRSLAAFVWEGGSINNLWKSDYYGARPAFNLDLAPVLLISTPEGKSAGRVGEFTELRLADSNERKLTLYDAGRHFSVSLPEDAQLTAESEYTDWTVTIDYSGAYVGRNEYISAILCASDGEALYYGSFIKNSSSGTLDIAIPDGLSNGKYELRLFSEQKNSGHITDYASAIETVELEIGCPEGGNHEWEVVNHKASFDQGGYQESVCSKCGESGGKSIGAMPVDIVKLGKKTYVYTGEAIEPEITVASSSDGPLSEDCYTITYSDNVNPGTATVTVTLKGDSYEGSKTLNFTIIPAGDTPPVIDTESLQITFAEGRNYAVTGSSVNVSVAVTDEDLDVSQVNLQYSKPISGDKEDVQLTYHAETGKWENTIQCDQSMEHGTWKIYSIEVLDRGGSLTRIINSAFDSDSNADLSAGDFQLRSTVTFDTRGGSSVDPQHVTYDEKATRPANPTKGGGAWHDGGDFVGWYADEALTQEFSFDSSIKEDITVYAKWEYGFSISSYDKTNSADCAGGRYMVLQHGAAEDDLYADGSNFTLLEGDEITLKAYPDQGYIFAGWYKGEYIGMVDYYHTQVSRPLDMSDPDNLLSTDPEYSFIVDRSAVVCPVFEMCPDHEWEQKIQKATPEEDGRVYRTCPICNAEEIITPLLKVGNISLKADSFPYTGDAIRPEVIVANANERLSEDYYDVTYTDNVDPGTASVTVALKGDYYEGSKTLDFTIYENSTKTVETNISRIEPGNRIWFGNLDQDNTAAQPETKWRVLETSEDRAMLISEELLDRIQYDTENRDWNESKARDWCLNYYDNWKGSQLEKAAIAETSKHDGRYQTGVQEIFGEIDITDEHFFLLSAEEADTLFKDNADRLAYSNWDGKSYYWWLRSDRPDYRSLAAFVWQGGSINNLWKSDYYGARPAFNLDLTPVLLISTPEGKSAGAIGEFTELRLADTNERKLTLHDPERDFKVSLPEDAQLAAESEYTDWTVAIDYSGAYEGDNEYISAILCTSDGEALYYGSFAKNSTSGTIEIPIPDGLVSGKYELRIFNEQKNSGHITDYASAIETVELEVGCPKGGDHEWKLINHKASFDQHGYQESVCTKCGESSGIAIGAMPVDIVELKETTYAYTGKAIEPEITVASSSDGPLSEDCYTITYSNNVNPGTATATVTLQGDSYEGSKTLNFTITSGEITPGPTEPDPVIPEPEPTPAPPKDEAVPYDRPIDAKDAPTVETMEKVILGNSTDEAPAGSRFNLLQLRATKVTKKSIKIQWTAVKGATGYIIYGARCRQKYGKLQVITTGSTKSWTQNKLSKGKYYKYLIVATQKYNGTDRVIASSKTIHIATSGGKVGNFKSVKLTNPKKAKIKLKVGKKFTIKAKAVAASKKQKPKNHRKLAYESTNPAVAEVSKKGKITAKKAGTCYVYVYAQNGVFKKIKVTIKK